MALAGLLTAVITGWIDPLTGLAAVGSFVLVVCAVSAVLVLTPPVKFLAQQRKELNDTPVIPSFRMSATIAGTTGPAVGILKLVRF